MGKKAKKKVKSGFKDKRNPVAPADPIDQKKSSENIGTPDDGGVAVVSDRTVCPHVDKVIDVEKVCAKIESSELVKCEDCREGVADRRAGKTKGGKHGKKKGAGDSKAIWVCLECGQFSCGGVGFPTMPQTHAVRHAKQHHHPLAVQFKNPQLRWCFPCDRPIHGKKEAEDSSEQKDVFHDIVKAIKRRPSEVGHTVDVEGIWFGSGSVISEINYEASASVRADGKSGYVVKGLVNLGNTCFFNSIMQNLLAMDRLRDYFLKLDGFAGPLTAALKKLFVETNPGASPKNSINPKSLFGSICAKAPQFRGYQQQDSHELLRCLLDRLCTEELTIRKQIKSSQDSGKSPSSCPTFVDDIFGGRLSSAVCCMECGHSSVVYEPLLDLSLSVPTKRSPAKGAQPAPRPKKSKPPKRSGKFRPKVSREASSFNCHNAQGNGEKSYSHVPSRVPVTEEMEVPSTDASIDSIEMAENMGLSSRNLCSSQTDNEKNCEGMTMQLASVNESTWLDYLDVDAPPNSEEMASQVDHVPTNQGPETDYGVPSVGSIQNNIDRHTEMKLTCSEKACSPDDLIHLNDQGQCNSLDCDIASEFSKKLLVKDSVEFNLETDSHTRLSADEAPRQVKDSEILLLPYYEVTSNAGDTVKEDYEVSSTVVGLEQDSMDFGGLGDLFNEPDCEENGVRESSMTARISSESDPEEVDNTNAPVSVESCLAYFTKPELLSKTEHAWQCENCAKLLKEQRMRVKNNDMMSPRSHNMANGQEDENSNGASSLGKFPTTDLRTHNGNSEPENFDDTLLSQKATSSQAAQENGVQENQGEANSQVNRDHQSNLLQLVEAPVNSAEGDKEEKDHKVVKAERDATKRILIDKVPPILTIHLKRFSQDARGRLSKLSGHVNFADTIDLKPYVDTRCLQKEIYKYRLIGVVEHSGTMRGGHYVAYIRGGPKITGKDNNAEDSVWYYASDAYVREVSLEEVLHCEAYILFYEET